MTKELNSLETQWPSALVRADVPHFVSRWAIRLRSWQLNRSAERSLSAMSDYQLKDIGLHRSEIGAALREAGRQRYRRS